MIDVIRTGRLYEIRFRAKDEAGYWSAALMAALDEELRTFEADRDSSVGLISAAGVFGGGYDPAALEAEWALKQNVREKIRAVAYPETARVPSAIAGFAGLLRWRVTKPLVLVASGACLDHALAFLGLHSDIRLAASDTRFGFPSIHRGFGSALGLASQLHRQIPAVWLNWLIETGWTLDAAQALDIGLINEVVPETNLLTRAREIALAIAAAPPLAVRAEKMAAVRLVGLDTVNATAEAVMLAALTQG